MKIVYYAPYDLRLPAGHTSHVLATVRQMVAKGHEVTLLARGCPEDVLRSTRFFAVPTLECAGLQSTSFGATAAVVLTREIIRRRPDAIYTRMFRSVSASLAVSRLFGVPAVVEVNSDLGNERRNSGRGSITRHMEEIEERVVFRLAKAIVAVTEGVAHYVGSVSPSARRKTRVIENGVDIGLYWPMDRAECSAQHGLNPSRKRVIFTGAFQAWQGVDDLVEAATIVARERDDVDFLLVGDGPLRGAIEAKIAEHGLQGRVTLTGFLPEAEVVSLIGASDLCAAPYNTEAVSDREADKNKRGALMRGSPLKVYTYMACGRPVVASHFLEAGAYLEENGAGIAVPPERPADLAAALLTLLGDTTRSRSMGENARRLAEERHSWLRVVDGYLTQLEPTFSDRL